MLYMIIDTGENFGDSIDVPEMYCASTMIKGIDDCNPEDTNSRTPGLPTDASSITLLSWSTYDKDLHSSYWPKRHPNVLIAITMLSLEENFWKKKITKCAFVPESHYNMERVVDETDLCASKVNSDRIWVLFPIKFLCQTQLSSKIRKTALFILTNDESLHDKLLLRVSSRHLCIRSTWIELSHGISHVLVHPSLGMACIDEGFWPASIANTGQVADAIGKMPECVNHVCLSFLAEII